METNRKRKVVPLNEADLEAIRCYHRRLAESDGFDIAGVVIPRGVVPLRQVRVRTYYPKVMLYARLGLHRYNMLFKKNLQLSSLRPPLNKLINTLAYFCITLDAFDPATPSEKMVFEVRVSEKCIYPLHLKCDIARPKGTREFSAPTCHRSTCYFYNVGLPEWPSSEDAFQDTERFYELNEYELQKHSWIRLYMELAFKKQTDTHTYKDLSHLRFDKVVIETKEPVEPPEERLNATWAILYIRFTHVFKRCPIKCKTVVRSFLNETTRDLTIRSSGFEKLDVGPPRRSARTRKPVERFIG